MTHKLTYEELEQRMLNMEQEARLQDEIHQQRTEEITRANEALRKTNRKLEEAHTQLLHSEKMASIGQLAAGVAHEINNPIGYINSNLGSLENYLRGLVSVIEAYERNEDVFAGFAHRLRMIETVKREIELDYVREDVFELVAESKEGLQRVKKIVQDLKEFSHTSATEWEFSDLHKGIESTLNIVQSELKYKANVTRTYGNIPEIQCLPMELNQVFMNLLVNAAQSIKSHGEISIQTGVRDEEVWVEVKDSGTGISEENLNRIFDPFFTTKPVGKGTGLGLTLSYNIVHKHGGHIEVNSTLGQGTAFRVWLPIKQPELQQETF